MSRKNARHAGAPTGTGRFGAGLAWAWIGVRELFVLGALGIALPVGVLVALPQFLDAGTAMTQAPTCAPNGPTSDCLVPVPATVATRLDTAPEKTWRLALEAPGDNVTLPFPRSTDDLRTGGALHVILWNGDPVAVLTNDGELVESLYWGRLYTLDLAVLRFAPLWPVAVVLLAWALFWRRHRPKLVVLTIIGVGTALAGPLAYLGMLLNGYPGLVAGALLPAGTALILAGLTLWRLRAKRRRDRVRRTEVRTAATDSPSGAFPSQRQPSADLEDDVLAGEQVSD